MTGFIGSSLLLISALQVTSYTVCIFFYNWYIRFQVLCSFLSAPFFYDDDVFEGGSYITALKRVYLCMILAIALLE